MKLYHHYKQKPYKLIGTVRHSETLEEMALYETRYENELGKLWVRPKEMFFETTKLPNGTSGPRFRAIPLELIEKDSVSDADLEQIRAISLAAFGSFDEAVVREGLSSRAGIHLILALVEGKSVGFKLGYRERSAEFYSWLGAVLPEYRGIGIASDMMRAQHAWAKAHGYEHLRTKTQNRFQDMLILNIRHGFKIVGTERTGRGDGLHLLMQKDL
jgi:GNAT superfamily N-acetyltransferase